MAKPLKDILAGVKKSKVVPGSTGKDPGVDYAPKAKDEQDFVAKHETEKHDDRVGNGDDVYQAKNVKYSLDKDDKHGHKSPKDKRVYDRGTTVKEALQCNMTEEGKYCPVHENTACPTENKKTLREIRKTVKEDKHVFHVYMPADDTRGHKMVDDKTSEPMGAKPKGHRLKITVPATSRTEATNKAAKYVAKNYGTNVKFTYSHKVDESLAVPLIGSNGDGDESAEMAKAELRALASKAMQLVTSIPDSMTIEPWVQSKITKAKDYVTSVHDYMVYGDHEEQTAPYDGGIDVSSGTVRNTFPNFSVDVNTGRNV